MSDIVEITIVNWEKHQPRKDIKKPWWFSLDNRITEDDKLQSLDSDEFRAFIHLLCLASQANSGSFSVNLTKAVRISGIAKIVFVRTIKKLTDFNIISQPVRDPYTIRTDAVHDPYTILQDTTRQDIIREDTATVEISTDCVLDPYRSKITSEIWDGWIKAFGDDQWVDAEINKAIAWIRTNPKKAPKSNFNRFFNNWLSTGWDRHRKGMPRATTCSPRALDRWGRPEPQGIQHPDAEDVIATMHDPEVYAMTDAQRKESLAKVRSLIAKVGNL